MELNIITLENGYAVLGGGRRFYARTFEQVCETVNAIMKSKGVNDGNKITI